MLQLTHAGILSMGAQIQACLAALMPHSAQARMAAIRFMFMQMIQTGMSAARHNTLQLTALRRNGAVQMQIRRQHILNQRYQHST
jgi:hypothetical protein